MTNKFISFLEAVGTDFKNGLAKIDPFLKEGIALAEAAAPEVAVLDPALGVIFSTVIATVSTIEQKFAAMGAQSGTGAQKLATAISILQPVVSQAFSAAGKPSDTGTVTNYINAVVGFLNAIPASVTPATPAS